MKRIDIMKRAGRNLRQAKGRTILTSLAIAVGAFTLTMALAAGQGTRDYAEKLLKNNVDPQAVFVVKDKQLFEQGGNIGLREYDPDIIASSTGRPGATLKQMNDEDVAYLEGREDLTTVIPVYRLSPKWIQFEANDKKYIGSIDYYDVTILNEAKAGTLPELGVQIADDEIVVPQAYADTLNVDYEDLVGSRVVVTFAQQSNDVSDTQIQEAFLSGGTEAVQQLVQPKEREYTFIVRAVQKSNTMALGALPMLNISTESAKNINQFVAAGSVAAGKYIGVSTLAKSGIDPEIIKQELEEKGYAVQTAKDAQSLLFTIVNTLQGIVAGFGVLTLFASVFGIINTQYISVLERTSQIGLMKALGMPRRAIAKLFRYEAAWIGLIGGVLGSGIALVVGITMNPTISSWLELGEDRILHFVWWQIGALLATLVLIAILAGWLPARKAARLDPIEALRTE
ncbi:ABC transporter permease [Candidatus Saccharibacteria bacterium]|nr:ABC transporter permease [Candidatus Saccharibacteria bacterium]